MRALKLLIAMGMLSVSVFASEAGAQAPTLPAGTVALVGAEPIPQAEFDHWHAIALREERGVVDPPRYERCIAADRRRARRAGRKPPRRVLRRRCEHRGASAQRGTMTFLVQSRWFRAEAAVRQITVEPERVRRYFEQLRDRNFKSRRAYRRFLRKSGLTEADLLVRAELELLQLRLLRGVLESARPVSAAEVRRYLSNHRREYRDMPRAKALRNARRFLTALRRARAILGFTRELRSRYRPITLCAPALAVKPCGGTASPPNE